jgi:hypothetical protein
MSQTSLFAKANNPDYLYFDLQTTNVYNNELSTQPNLKFLESRDSPIVPNSGDYHMSVIRFQTDNYNLPVLLAEPDLTTSNSGPFDPKKTIHKVAVYTENAYIPYSSPGIVAANPAVVSGAAVAGDEFGTRLQSAFDDSNRFVVGAPSQGTNPGEVYYFDVDSSPVTKQALPVPGTQNNERNGSGVGISHDGQRIISCAYGDPGELYLYNYTRSAGVWSLDSSMNTTLNADERGQMLATNSMEADGTDKGQIIVGSKFDENKGTIHIYSIDLTTGAFNQELSFSTAVTNANFGAAVAMSATGYVAVATQPNFINPSVSITGAVVIFTNTDRTTPTWIYNQTLHAPGSFGTNSGYGASVALDAGGNTIVVGSPYAGTYGSVVVYTLSSGIWNQTQIIDGSSGNGFGTSVALSPNNGLMYIGRTDQTIEVYTFGTTWTFLTSITKTDQSEFGKHIITGGFQGLRLITGSSNPAGTGVQGGIVDLFDNDTYASVYPVPNGTLNIPQVKSVYWTPDQEAEAPPRSQLTGRNTAIFPYYRCHSYEAFISSVNQAIEQAFISNYNHLWTNWVSTASATEKAVFLDAAYRSFSTPPIIDWSNTNLATFFVNQCFNSYLDNNYAVPKTNWTNNTTSHTATGIEERRPPFNFKIAFNSSLYALFNSFPAKEKILTIGGVKERYYEMSFFSSGKDLVTAVPPLTGVPYSGNTTYSFSSVYRDSITGRYTIPIPTTGEIVYSYVNDFIKQVQELVTITTWTPINAIVFTSNTLPIVPNQVSAVSTLGVEPTPSSTGNDFALIITDIQSSDGFLPNILYVPSGENRYIDMTGNQPIRNIDINVFYRVKTGQLIPLRLPSGGTASIKLLFKKKIQAEKQKIQFQKLSVKDTGA